MADAGYSPLSEDAIAAIRDARFKTCNLEHSWAIIYDSRPELFERIGIGATPYRRGEGVDYEARSVNPEIIALCAQGA